MKEKLEGLGLFLILSTMVILFSMLLYLFVSVTEKTFQIYFDDYLNSQILMLDTKGLPPSYITTVGVLESGYGISRPYRELHNIFNITDDKNGIQMGNHKYRKYETDIDSIKDFITHITTIENYRPAYEAAILDNRKEFFRSLKKAGYAEDPKYAEKLEKTFQGLKQKELVMRLKDDTTRR